MNNLSNDQRHVESMNNRNFTMNPETSRAFLGRSSQSQGTPQHTDDTTGRHDFRYGFSSLQRNTVDLRTPLDLGEMNQQQNHGVCSLPFHSFPNGSAVNHQYSKFSDPSAYIPISYQNFPNVGSATVHPNNQQQEVTPLQSDFQFNNEFHDLSVLHDHTDSNLAGVYFTPSLGSSRLDVDYTASEIPDIPDTCFNYITDLLKKDFDVDEIPCTLDDIMAFQNCYRSFSDALSQSNPSSSDQDRQQQSVQKDSKVEDNLYGGGNGSCHGSNSSIATADDLVEKYDTSSGAGNGLAALGSTLLQFPLLSRALLPSEASAAAGHPTPPNQGKCDWLHEISMFVPNTHGFALAQPRRSRLIRETEQTVAAGEQNFPNLFDNHNGVRKKHPGNSSNHPEEGRNRNKQMATESHETYPEICVYEEKLFCPEGRDLKAPPICPNKLDLENDAEKAQKDDTPKPTGRRGRNNSRAKKQQGFNSTRKNTTAVVDLRDLLIHCAQAISRVDLSTATELLQQIRQHSSPRGDSIQRIGHYFAEGLEARLAGNFTSGTSLLPSGENVSVTETLKAIRIYVAAVPFMIMSLYITNKTIATLSFNEPKLHIIDFGINLGLQWPCIIYNLAQRNNGPLKLKITGIDFPQPGFRPSERLEETGRCLSKYAERFNLPFEYHAIAKKWEDVKVEDLNIGNDEMVFVNCLYRSQQLFDESVDENSPRDTFLNLVKDIKPEYFMHGVINGLYGAPFFVTRFREAMYHYAALFDLFEATMPREDQERILLESKVYGKEIFNAIACEGVERIERPETYKRWQVKTKRMGFKQVGLDEGLLKRAKAMVKKSFRQEFVLDEDDKWAIQGWKGRILFAISCWKLG